MPIYEIESSRIFVSCVIVSPPRRLASRCVDAVRLWALEC